MAEKYCIGCMKLKEADITVCPHCGFDESQYVPPPMALSPGSMLANGKYLVGRTLGQGGFGVTYLALDQFLELRVAIKEYLPRNMAYRTGDSNSLHWHSTVMDKKTGRESFIREAKKMARIDEIPNVVRVKDVFYENDTAYIVMDYVEGETLLKHLKRTGPLSGADCLSLLHPVMKALSEAHSQGLIHRDISPDNIMLDKRNRVWLLDLGAAKELDVAAPGSSGHTSTVAVYKDGFSPLEQYAITLPDQSGDKKNIGPWTDVYAMSATIFYCMSGRMLPPAPNRVLNPRLELPEIIPPDIAEVLVKGLTLLPDDRIKTMDEFWTNLEAASFSEKSKREEEREQEEDRWKAEEARRQEAEQYNSLPRTLSQGSTLSDGKYLICKTLGQSDTNATYLAVDLVQNLQVVIKEYLPVGFVCRPDESNTVHWHSSVKDKRRGPESFIIPAAKTARLSDIPSIARVRQVFIENETAYIVMDYVEGVTLLQYLKRTGCDLSLDACLNCCPSN